VAIDFRLTAGQRELQLRSRKFAKDVLSPTIEAETLPTPEKRFAATKSAYEAMIAAGFLRQCIPRSVGGENDGLIDTTIRGERQRDLDIDRNASRITATFDRRHKGAARSPAACFLEAIRRSTRRILRDRTRRQCQSGIASSWRGRTYRGKAFGRQMDHPGSKKLGLLGHGLGSQGRGRSVGPLSHRSRCSSRAEYFDPARGASCIRLGLRTGDRFGGTPRAPLAAVRIRSG